MERFTRRDFMGRLAAGSAAVVAASIPRAEAFWGRGGDKDEWLALGPLEGYATDGVTAVAAATRVDGGKAVRGPKLAVVRRGEAVGVLSTRCTHFGCEVAWKDDRYVCPCHGAEFDAAGAVLKGPAKRPLVWYAVRTTGAGELEVNLGAKLETAPL